MNVSLEQPGSSCVVIMALGSWKPSAKFFLRRTTNRTTRRLLEASAVGVASAAQQGACHEDRQTPEPGRARCTEDAADDSPAVAYVSSTPLSEEVVDRYFLPLGRAYAMIMPAALDRPAPATPPGCCATSLSGTASGRTGADRGRHFGRCPERPDGRD